MSDDLEHIGRLFVWGLVALGVLGAVSFIGYVASKWFDEWRDE